jgi:pyruvate/2-oxoglutarate dehydrogenase complex dihydrolipoamide dehydrogenase (E3) component
VHNRAHGRTFQLGFDLLHIATGSRPKRPDLPGLDLPQVHGVQTLTDASRLLDDARTRRPRQVVVIGSGYVGLELAEAFVIRGASVTVVEPGPDVMAGLDRDMAPLVARAMRQAGITVRTGEEVSAVTEASVATSGGEIPADLVILGLGVEPNSDLGAKAELDTGVRGALLVDRQQRTSSEGVYATFPGVAGTAVTKICRVEIGRTGLGEREAERAGFSAVGCRVEATTTASYVPEVQHTTVKLVAERESGRVLGAQIVGGQGSAKRVDVIATALAGRLTVDDLLGLDLGYSPAFSSLWDPLQVAARQLLPQV